jgi:type II secretory pathway pseudopilin PulG
MRTLAGQSPRQWHPARTVNGGPAATKLALSHPTAYTLLELLLVLTIIVAVAGAVAPTVVARMSEYHLKQGAEAARAALAAARIHAIDLSSVYQFRFEPGGRRFLALPTDGEALKVGAQTPNAAQTAVVSGELPETIVFQATAPMTSSTSTVLPPGSSDSEWTAALARVQNIASFAQAAWSAPICYRPDGSAMDAVVNIVDQKNGGGFQLKVRELTGEVFVTPLPTETR